MTYYILQALVVAKWNIETVKDVWILRALICFSVPKYRTQAGCVISAWVIYFAVLEWQPRLSAFLL